MDELHPLRRWRHENDVTISQLAEQLGLSVAFLSMVETNLKGVSLNTAVELSDLTGLDVREFMREAAE